MNVDAAASRNVEQPLREDLAEGHHHRDVGRQRPDRLAKRAVVHLGRLHQIDSVLEGPLSHRRWLRAAPPPHRASRLSHDQNGSASRRIQCL